MTRTLAALTAAALLALAPAAGQAAGWTLSAEGSKIAYGSIKSGAIGEVNRFTGLAGSVDPSGAVTVEITLASIDTGIEIRDERMGKFVFDAAFPKAVLKAQVDLAALEALKPGETATQEVEGALVLNGREIPVETSLFIARLGPERALVVTDEMIMLSTEDAGVDAAVTKLMEIAQLPSIARVAPVTMRLLFTKGAGGAPAATPATPAATAAAEPAPTETAAAAAAGGDVAAGKKVFRKCRACHVAEKAQNRTGPHLVGLFGRQAGAIDGFRYSKAMAGSGITWTEETVAAYLADPKGYIPGNRMAFAGLKKEQERTDLIAYLKSWGE